MYEPVYPLAILTPYLANVTDDSARISLYVISDLLHDIHGQLICSIHTLDTFSVLLSFAFDVSLESPDMRHVTDLSYLTLMKRADCSSDNQCILYCSFNYDHQKIGQTLFLTRPKNYQLYQPNLQIQNIQQVSPTEAIITITATRPALFVWLDVSANISGYFSRNGFHMFKPTKTIRFHSWTPITDFDNVNFDVRITSLFDITQP